MENLKRFRQGLLSWYKNSHREMPWRTEPTPYRVWISEIMLQQTQVTTVVAYFLRFMEAFPTIESLAAATEMDVLRAWEGLGYYRRAKNLHAAAKEICRKHSGKFPRQFDDILALPGIGRYTAGAISSIAFQNQKPILEGNTIRLFARLQNIQGDVSLPATQNLLWSFAESLVANSRRPGDINQALMELGNQICTVKNPHCISCPVIQHCDAFLNGDPSKLPNKPRKIQYESLMEAAIVVRRNKKTLVRLCLPGDRWAGLWDFPRFSISEPTDSMTLNRLLQQTYGLRARSLTPEFRIKHAVTRFRIELHCFWAEGVTGKTESKTPVRWVNDQQLHSLPLSATGRRMLEFKR